MKYIEATLLLPMTFLIVITLMTFTMECYFSLQNQIDEHGKELEKMYGQREVLILRAKDGIIDVLKN